MGEFTGPAGPASPSEDLPDPSVSARAQDPGLGYPQIIDLFLSAYDERPALAERAYRIRVDPASGERRREVQPRYRSITYGELRRRVRALAMAWRPEAGAAIPPGTAIHPGERVVILGFASIDYATIDLALAYGQAIPVPLSGHHSSTEYDAIVRAIAPAALAVSIAQLPLAVELVLRHDGIRHLIVFDADLEITTEQRLLEEAERRLRAAGSPIPLLPLQQLIARGDPDRFEWVNPAGLDLEDTALLIHTSGSTGLPKAACIPAKALINTWRKVLGPFPRVVVVLAPFHHMMGRDSMVGALNSGGTAHFTLSPDLSTVFEDIRLVRPTSLVLFPRLCEWIHQHAQSLNAGAGAPCLRGFLGDRLQSIVVASAPIAPSTRRFLEQTFAVPVREGYSSTETASGGLAMDGVLNRHTILDYRLRDVPESGYFRTDQPYPRGELCVKTRFGIRGYFNNPEATADLFDSEGFCCTGDVVEERGPNRIALIDRRRNVVKLSQGEFVAVGRLEALFAEHCPTVDQIHVHGESSRAYLLAVVVPDRQALASGSPAPASDADLSLRLREEMLRVARDHGLRGFEIPRDVIVADEPFTHANGLLSSLGKPIRPALRQRYRVALEQLYASHERLGRRELESLRQPDGGLSIESRLGVVLRSTLGVGLPEEAASRTFRELGGDSLAAVQLAVRIEQAFGVAIEGSQILGPRGTLAEWARLIREAEEIGEAPGSLPVNSGRSSPAPVLAADDFRLARFFDPPSLPVPPQPPPGSAAVRTVLLTGANGFLGGRVCLAWLERLSSSGGRLIALVRPSQGLSARERLEARFAHHDAATAARFRWLAERHLEVVAGDIGEPFLGLDDRTYARLAHEVEAICHCAALVNHRLPYQHVYRPNVIGTAEIVRLALSHRRKSIDFVSTIGVASFLRQASGATSSAPGAVRLPVNGSYASGYFASKWACEQLLRSSHQEVGLPVRVVRPALVLPDRRLAGELNHQDILSRLIISILLTGLAPESFAGTGPEGPGFQAAGLPVDQLAEAIVALGDMAPEGFHLFSLGDQPADRFPLDALLDRIEAAGHPLERIRSYGDWLDRIERDLLRLPPTQQARSLLDVLEAYKPTPNADPSAMGPTAGERAFPEPWAQQLRARFPPAYLSKILDDVAELADEAAARPGPPP